jgi:hypothetical protein
VKTKQNIRPDSFWEQKRRFEELQSDLLRIVGALGMSRSLLQRRDNWDNASRDPNEYEPYRPYDKQQAMIRDVVRTVADRGNSAQRAAVRKAVTQFYETLMRDALEFLGEESETDVIALTLECNREVTEAECALTTAIASKTPENYERAARENTEALTVMERLRDGCFSAARALRGGHLRVAR